MPGVISRAQVFIFKLSSGLWATSAFDWEMNINGLMMEIVVFDLGYLPLLPYTK